jgi:hypothetical protein
MNRDNLIKKLVERKMNEGKVNAGCVPCFGRALCFAPGQRQQQTAAKE